MNLNGCSPLCHSNPRSLSFQRKQRKEWWYRHPNQSLHWKGGGTYGRMDGRTDVRTSGNSPLCPIGHRPFGERNNEWTNERMNEWKKKRMNERMNEWKIWINNKITSKWSKPHCSGREKPTEVGLEFDALEDEEGFGIAGNIFTGSLMFKMERSINMSTLRIDETKH